LIDNLTGLPALPEGEWWEVREREVESVDYYGYGTYTYLDGYEVVWWKPNTSKTKIVYKRRHWYSLFKSYFDEYSEEPIAYGRWRIESTKTSRSQIDARGVKDAAKSLVAHMAGKSATRSLLGTYPPKSL
jgi:hypothetical protein